MRYIIMCGGAYEEWETPRQLIEINGEPIVRRTIRLLQTAGVRDVAISANGSGFANLGVPVLRHANPYAFGKGATGYWFDCFYPTEEPACYIFGDVVFSPEAIQTIVETETDDILLFGSKRPFAPEYPKKWEEPFAFKVQNQRHLRETIAEVKRLDAAGKFTRRRPIAWELWFVACGQDPAEDLENPINNSYIGINDYTCDIDHPSEVARVTEHIHD